MVDFKFKWRQKSMEPCHIYTAKHSKNCAISMQVHDLSRLEMKRCVVYAWGLKVQAMVNEYVILLMQPTVKPQEPVLRQNYQRHVVPQWQCIFSQIRWLLLGCRTADSAKVYITSQPSQPILPWGKRLCQLKCIHWYFGRFFSGANRILLCKKDPVLALFLEKKISNS